MKPTTNATKAKATPTPKQDPLKDQTYPAGMETERAQPVGLGRNKPGPKNPPEAATVEDEDYQEDR